MEEVVLLDSDSDTGPSPSKNRRTSNNRGCRKTNRGRMKLRNQNLDTENTFCNANLSEQASDNVTDSIYVDKDKPDILPSVSNVTAVSVPHNEDIGSVNRRPLFGESSVAHSSTSTLTVPTQPRKTGRRGLAKRDTSDLTTGDIVSTHIPSTAHRSSVYSKCVSYGFQSIYGKQREKDRQDDNSNKGETSKQMADDYTVGQMTSDGGVTSSEESDPSSKSVEDENIDLEEPTAADSLRSPTPPPELQNSKQHRMSKRVAKALRTLTTTKANLIKETNSTTPWTKSRRRRRGDPPVIVQVDSPMVKADMVIKVRYLSTVHRLRHNMIDPFHLLLTKMSQEIGKEEHELGLFLHDSSLSLSSTPKDVSLSVADIIECYCMTDVEGNRMKGDAVNVVIQCSNSKKKTSMVAYKRLPLKELMERYAAKFDLDTSTFSFCFDGDYVSPMDTLFKLDFEDGDVLDVIPKQDGQKLKSSHNPYVITLI